MIDENNISFAVFTLRVILGILLFSQGYEKFFKIGLKEVANTVVDYEQQFNPPNWMIRAIVFVNSFIELIGGLLLILGLMKITVLYILGANFIMVTIAMSMNKSMWDMKYFFPRLILFITLLLIPSRFDQWTLDALFGCCNF